MDDFQELYRRIEYLRSNGVKMKEIADCVNMPASVLSSLYTTVLPFYFTSVKTTYPEEALDQALGQVNNVSKKRLLTSLENMIDRLNELEPTMQNNQKENPFAEQLKEEISLSARKAEYITGTYISYSLSSSSENLKIEPFIISLSENKEYVRIGRLSAYGEMQWGVGIIGERQNLYCMLSENPSPQFDLVTIYFQIPLFKYPKQLRGLYIGVDYNHNPIARRIILIRQSENTTTEEILQMQSGIVEKTVLTPEQQVYYEYTCQNGDYIKMCTVPSLRMDESDLVREKKMLEL